MNKGKKQVTSKISKKIQKEFKKGVKEELTKPKLKLSEEKILQPKETLKRQPKKAAKIQESRLKAMAKSMKIKKAKLSSKHSKRTQPEDAVVNSVPAHVHQEGKRWIKTLTKQNVIENKRLTKRLSKKK